MPARITIITPENVELNYELAGLGSRFLAALTDIMLQFLSLLVIVFGAAAIGTGGASLGINWGAVGPWGWALIIILGFLIIWGYYVFFETRWNGQTPGKRSLGIRVIRDGGYPIDFRAALIRNLVRYADFFPGFYGLGTIAIFLSNQNKRLGDYAAGTVVIKERGREDVVPAAIRERPQPVLLNETMSLNVSRLTKEDYTAVKHFLDRRGELTTSLATDLARRIAAPIVVKLGSDPNTMPHDAVTLLEEIAAAYESRHRL